jgi:hypothetical protein
MEKTIFDKKTLTPKEAAIYIGVSVATLSRMRREGIGAKYICIKSTTKESKGRKRTIRYLISELDRFLEQAQIKTA